LSEHGQTWAGDANEIVVAAYLDMFAKVRAGEQVNKTQAYRDLSQIVGKGHKAVEFKFQNISHVMELLGYPWLPGLKPLSNIQTSLLPAVERALDLGQSQFLLEPQAAKPGLEDASQLYLGPPPVGPTQPANEGLRRLIRKFDPAARDASNKRLGDAGEEYVFKRERAFLRLQGRDDLSRKVQWTAKELGDGAGYDIHSFDLDGTDRLIEVKTTVGNNRTPFFLSENERLFAEERPDAFRLFRLHDFYTEPGAFELAPPLTDHVLLKPTAYRASLI
jgi:hypothetical protein